MKKNRSRSCVKWGTYYVTVKGNKIVVERPGHPKLYGTINGNSGALLWPGDPVKLGGPGDVTHDFTFSGGTIRCGGEIFTKKSARYLTTPEKE